jgi:two-component system chemotaxis response regulator CheY
MKTILAVDDSASVRHMVKITLNAAGYQVIEASDGRDGLNQAKANANAVAMIVTDLNMPNMNGLEFIREVRKLPPYRGVPIVFLTTESDDGMKQQAKAAGATGWITKPFRQEQLLAAAKKFLG